MFQNILIRLVEILKIFTLLRRSNYSPLMNFFLKYDILRLEACQKNENVRDSITISREENLTLLKFKLLKYFNYGIGKIENQQVLERIKNFYADSLERHHQILLNSNDLESQSILEKCPDYELIKSVAVVYLEPKENFQDFSKSGLSLIRVNEKTISEFAWLYLKCFEAENWHPESVEENFRNIFESKGVRFYFLYFEGSPIGITGVYQHDDFYFLSAGAVLPEFRNFGFHKVSLSLRLAMCRNENPDLPIFSWAYFDSISHKNMVACGMSLRKKLLVFQYVG